MQCMTTMMTECCGTSPTAQHFVCSKGVREGAFRLHTEQKGVCRQTIISEDREILAQTQQVLLDIHEYRVHF